MGRDYDKLARDCNLSKRFLKNITSSERNENILRWLRDDDLYALSIGEGDTDYSEFIVREGDDLGWLGFYIGKCRTLEALHIFDMPGDMDQIEEFLRELSRNRSLQELCINTDLGDAITEKFGEFFRHNKSLYELDLRYFDIGRESAHKLAITLCDTSLKSLELTGNGLCKEGFTEIVTVVSAQTHIENLTVRSNNVGRIGCTALGTLLGSRALTLKDLDLGFNGIDNESLQLLAAGLTNNTTLEVLILSLCGNTSVTGGGLRSLIPCLQSDRCSLVMLFFYHMHIGDEGTAAFAQGLSKNKTLKRTCGSIPQIVG